MRKCILALAFAFSFSAFSAEPIAIPKIKEGEPLPANLFVQLAKAVNPAVVNVFTTYLPKGRAFPGGRGGPQGDPLFEMFEQFMGPQGIQQAPQQSLGTGFLIREDGLIITNNHVVDHADGIKVQITEGNKESFDAKVIGHDAKLDIALIKIDAKRKLPFVKLGTSSSAQVGEWVAAFGNPYGYGHSMSKGIISALGREIDELNSLAPFIQVDASINPGNSGGPLVNTAGEVIGVNTAIDARGQGIGFVIPIDNVKAVLPELEKNGGIKRAFLGVQMADVDPEGARQLKLKQTDGALIMQVIPNTSAAKAGMQLYDLVVEFGGNKVTSTRDLSKAVATSPIGKEVNLKVIRNGQTKVLQIVLGGEPTLKALSPNAGRKSENGSKAPFDLGFAMADYSLGIAQEFGLPRLSDPRPVVTAVNPDGPAAKSGMAPGDIILDVNRNSVAHPKDVLKNLKPGTLNILRILKQDRVVLISVRAS
ncbi:MAG: trypsin-like peptidase domain-containing protein [Bdellovibrionales bacterium]